ncbi:MAG: NADH pyrophosphatase [Trizodia sp. TS-e1964]|nr:MAG: NADH pyrophosphatase [Trizodia sp. TS-e1964]
MLTQKYGPGVANYYSGSPLNRVSFLRTNNEFLRAALIHPSSSFLLFKDLAPLVTDPSSLTFVSYEEVKPLIGNEVYIKHEDQLVKEYDSTVTLPLIVFLGLDESNTSGYAFRWGLYKGTPHFALDVTPRGSIGGKAENLISTMESRGCVFLQTRILIALPAAHGLSRHPPSPRIKPELTSGFLANTAAIFAQARALLDWNARNPFCAQCGQPTFSTNAGTKRTCPPTDSRKPSINMPLTSELFSDIDTKFFAPLDETRARLPCATRKGVHNISFPRTDPSIIVAVLSADSRRALIGRQKRWPPKWYSTLAGFVEPGESVEEAVRREVWEESGILVGRVVLHSSQPWPYPASLMIGAVAEALPGGEEIVLKHDPELEDARWITIQELAEALSVATSNGFGELTGDEVEDEKCSLKLPPSTAIAHQLLKAVVDGCVGCESKI